HRPVLPTIIDSVRAVAQPGAALELPREDPFLAAGEALLLHTTPGGTVVAIERHLPHIGRADAAGSGLPGPAPGRRRDGHELGPGARRPPRGRGTVRGAAAAGARPLDRARLRRHPGP